MPAQLKERDEKEYEDDLNDLYGDVSICGMSYAAGYALREIDPIAFRVGMSDMPDVWECSECNVEYEDELDAESCCAPEEE
jgi:hypothetical protein